MSEGLRYAVCASSEGEIRAHLIACNAQFEPPLSTRVDIAEYAEKLKQRALAFEAWDGSRLVGLAAAYIAADAGSCYITNVSVISEFTGKGVATTLLDQVIAHARRHNLSEITLEVAKQSVEAVRMYTSLGFRPAEDRNDRLLMRCELNPSSRSVPKRAGGMRNHNLEYKDNQTRKYSYDFDAIIRRYLLRTLEPHFVRGGTALELGCYKGDMTEQILEYFPKTTVVEAASDLAEIVRNRFSGRVEVINSTFEGARIDRRYDNVFLIHTLEHLDDRIGILARFRNWLSPTGKLFVAVPNANALSRQIAVKMGLIEYHSAVTGAEAKHGHRCTYSMDVLLSEARRAGYRVEDYGGVLLKPLANFQFDRAIAEGIVSEAYLEACHELAKTYPDLSASLYVVCTHPK